MGNSADPSAEPQTWHYGVVAKWWAEINTLGPEIAYFQPYVEAGQPALDVEELPIRRLRVRVSPRS